MDHKLIFPGGKLTPKGLAECQRLIEVNQMHKPAVDNGQTLREKTIEDVDTDDDIIELKEEVEPVAPAGAGAPTAPKVVPLLFRPAMVKSEPTSQFDIKGSSATPSPVEEPVIEGNKKTLVDHQDTIVTTVPGIPAEMDGRTVAEDSSPAPMPGISFDDQRLHKNLVTLMDPQSYEAEQFKMLRNNILFPAEGEAPRTILVTSCLPGEGKSFVSANLAASIAMNINKHVLLIDSDLRKPDLHRVYGFGAVPGLSDYLAEHRSLDSLLLKTAVEKLTLLPGGPVLPNPSELASSERMSAMLEEVKQRYQDRLIVIDSPPPTLAAETSFLARQVDGILLVVKYGKTPKEDVEELMETVGSDKILGVVINYLDMPMSRRYGYGKYGKYGTYGNGTKVKRKKLGSWEAGKMRSGKAKAQCLKLEG